MIKFYLLYSKAYDYVIEDRLVRENIRSRMFLHDFEDTYVKPALNSPNPIFVIACLLNSIVKLNKLIG